MQFGCVPMRQKAWDRWDRSASPPPPANRTTERNRWLQKCSQVIFRYGLLFTFNCYYFRSALQPSRMRDTAHSPWRAWHTIPNLAFCIVFIAGQQLLTARMEPHLEVALILVDQSDLFGVPYLNDTSYVAHVFRGPSPFARTPPCHPSQISWQNVPFAPHAS